LGGLCFERKIEVIKIGIKGMHQRHCQNLPARMLSLKEKIATLDLKGGT